MQGVLFRVKTPPWLRVEFWSCVGLVLFFFLPWVSIGGVINLTGYQVANLMRQRSGKDLQRDRPMKEEKLKLPLICAALIYLILIVSAICAITDMAYARKRPLLLYLISGCLPFGSLLLALADLGSEIFQVLSIGAWLTLVAAAGCLVGPFLPKLKSIHGYSRYNP